MRIYCHGTESLLFILTILPYNLVDNYDMVALILLELLEMLPRRC